MEQYIPKSIVLAEIERLRGLLPDANDCDYLQLEFARGQQDAFTDFEEFIRTLEVKEEVLDSNEQTKLMQECVKTAFKSGYDMGTLQTTKKINSNTKEVDFEIEWKEYFRYRGNIATVNIKELARHFFNLGLKAREGK